MLSYKYINYGNSKHSYFFGSTLQVEDKNNDVKNKIWIIYQIKIGYDIRN